MTPDKAQYTSGMMRGRIVSSVAVVANKEYAYEIEILDHRHTGGNLVGARNINRPWPDSLNIDAAPVGSDCIVFFTANSYTAAVFCEKPQTTECEDAPAP